MNIEFLVRGEQVSVTEEEALQLKAQALGKGLEFLNLIDDQKIRNIAMTFWNEAPLYFFVIPASSSGKYHWAKETGGLFDHVLMGMHCAYELASTFGLKDKERDIAIAAMAGHDCLKYGIEYDYRYFDMHPFLPRSYYKKMKAVTEADKETVYQIFDAIERHMGNMFQGKWTSVGRIYPQSPVEQVVHLSDFMASRSEIVMPKLINK